MLNWGQRGFFIVDLEAQFVEDINAQIEMRTCEIWRAGFDELVVEVRIDEYPLTSQISSDDHHALGKSPGG